MIQLRWDRLITIQYYGMYDGDGWELSESG